MKILQKHLIHNEKRMLCPYLFYFLNLFPSKSSRLKSLDVFAGFCTLGNKRGLLWMIFGPVIRFLLITNPFFSDGLGLEFNMPILNQYLNLKAGLFTEWIIFFDILLGFLLAGFIQGETDTFFRVISNRSGVGRNRFKL